MSPGAPRAHQGFSGNLEMGDRAHGDEASYPDDDIKAAMGPDGTWRFTHKDGLPYE